jgi:hypothetical protein
MLLMVDSERSGASTLEDPCHGGGDDGSFRIDDDPAILETVSMNVVRSGRFCAGGCDGR